MHMAAVGTVHWLFTRSSLHAWAPLDRNRCAFYPLCCSLEPALDLVMIQALSALDPTNNCQTYTVLAGNYPAEQPAITYPLFLDYCIISYMEIKGLSWLIICLKLQISVSYDWFGGLGVWGSVVAGLSVAMKLNNMARQWTQNLGVKTVFFFCLQIKLWCFTKLAWILFVNLFFFNLFFF